MLRHYYIKKEWIVSARARHIFRTAAVFSLTLFLIIMWKPTEGQLPALLVWNFSCPLRRFLSVDLRVSKCACGSHNIMPQSSNWLQFPLMGHHFGEAVVRAPLSKLPVDAE